jgi:hypothetical protein
VIRPCASRQVLFDPLLLELPVFLPWASRKVVRPVLDVVAVPVILPWASRKVVWPPEVRAVAEARPLASLSVAFCPARDEDEPGSAHARTGTSRIRIRINFMGIFDDLRRKIFNPFTRCFKPLKTTRPKER